MDTEMTECNSGRGMWIICRNPTCYRCDIIEQTEMEEQIPYEKGATILFVGRMKAEDASWAESTARQIICIIIHFLKSDTQYIMKLL
eukprot:11135517-Heterocapsa_arctica.AAC.1